MSISKASKYSVGIIHTYIEVAPFTSGVLPHVSSLSLSLSLSFFCLSLASFQIAKRIITVDNFHAGRKGNFWKPLLQCYVSFASFIIFSIWFLLNSHLFYVSLVFFFSSFFLPFLYIFSCRIYNSSRYIRPLLRWQILQFLLLLLFTDILCLPHRIRKFRPQRFREEQRE